MNSVVKEAGVSSETVKSSSPVPDIDFFELHVNVDREAAIDSNKNVLVTFKAESFTSNNNDVNKLIR